jgi:carboxyl-terminal processing protease
LPARNALILILTTLVCLGCFIQARRLKYAGRIGSAIELIEQNYVDPVKGEDLYQSAMKGLLDLDPYSEFIPQPEYVQFQAQIEQQFGGVGIMIEGPPSSRRLTVVTPLANTPAYAAGIQPGDEITQIDGQSTEGMTSDEARDHMRGIVGTAVTLTIKRLGQEKEFDVLLHRADIQVDSVVGDRIQVDSSWNYFLREAPEIAYIRVTLFGERTAEEFRSVLQAVAPKARALVIDLRFNPGGILTAAVEMCDMLLSEGRIVSTKGRQSAFDTTLAATPELELPLAVPVIILQNGQSASASEIMAACLQDNGRAMVAGERSFGKGTVQQVFEIGNARTAIKFTTARYFRPSGANIHRTPEMQDRDVWGVVPDEALERKLSDVQQIALFRRWQQLGDPRWTTGPHPPSPPFSGDPQLRLVVEHLQHREARSER